jgi:hypothetical protein
MAQVDDRPPRVVEAGHRADPIAGFVYFAAGNFIDWFAFPAGFLPRQPVERVGMGVEQRKVALPVAVAQEIRRGELVRLAQVCMTAALADAY